MLGNLARTVRRPLSRRRPTRPRPSFTPGLLQLEDRLVPSGDGLVGLANIDHFVVIYQENWSFDGLYGKFPGANGISNASQTSLTQVDRTNGQPLSGEASYNPASKYSGGADATLQNPPPPLSNTGTGAIDTRFLTDPANPASATKVNTLQPYDLSQFVAPSAKTGDIVHRFWQEQSQIDGGQQNQYVTWSDNPGLVMSNFDASNLPEGQLAKQFVMEDNFFHTAYGGSFLNHQFLIAAQAPVYPNAPSAMQATLDASGRQLALDANGKIVHDGNITPVNTLYDKNYAINTIFSKNLVPAGSNPSSTGLLPSQNDSNPNDPNRPYIPTIGDRLNDGGVNWKWYSGGWDAALASSPSNPANNGQTPANPTVDPNFQWHHQPLAYYDNFAPWLNGQRNAMSAAHLQDETNFFTDLANGALPAVSFIKPIGANNEHPGYTDLLTGQQHVADIVRAIQSNPAWAHTAIIITYDENGGRWDHASPPNDYGIWGNGTRVPGIIISPYAKASTVDHTEHDTLSILKTIEERFGVKPLTVRDASANDLSSAFTGTPSLMTAGAFDPTTGVWYLRNSNTPGAPDAGTFAYGGKNWISVLGDWTGRGIMSVGVVDPAMMTWYLKNDNTPGAPDFTPFAYGQSGDVPVVGDWDGNGTFTVGVYRPSTATWYLRNSNSAGAPDITPFAYGGAGWKPVVGDWDGNKTTTVGVFDPSGKWYLRNSNSPGVPDITPFAYGVGSWTPVAGDWNGDRVWTAGVVDPTGKWYLKNTNAPGAPDITPFAYGAPIYRPVSGEYGHAFLPLQAAVADGTAAPAAALTGDDARAIVAAALDRLRGAGVDAEIVARLASAQVEVVPLPPGYLGFAEPSQNRILLSPNASGRGWFVDPTPLQDEEYAGGVALPGTAAAGRVDLLTVVLHEMSHLDGQPDQNAPGLLDAALTAGVRLTDNLAASFPKN